MKVYLVDSPYHPIQVIKANNERHAKEKFCNKVNKDIDINYKLEVVCLYDEKFEKRKVHSYT